MPSSFVTIPGEIWYARTDTPETDPWGNTKWSVCLYPDKEAMPEVLDLMSKGIKNVLKKDDDNEYNITFSRPSEKETKKGLMKFDPPKVFVNGKPTTELVGNGSKGDVKLEVMSFKGFQGANVTVARLHSLDIKDFIPYGAMNVN